MYVDWRQPTNRQNLQKRSRGRAGHWRTKRPPQKIFSNPSSTNADFFNSHSILQMPPPLHANAALANVATSSMICRYNWITFGKLVFPQTFFGPVHLLSHCCRMNSIHRIGLDSEQTSDSRRDRRRRPRGRRRRRRLHHRRRRTRARS